MCILRYAHFPRDLRFLSAPRTTALPACLHPMPSRTPCLSSTTFFNSSSFILDSNSYTSKRQFLGRGFEVLAVLRTLHKKHVMKAILIITFSLLTIGATAQTTYGIKAGAAHTYMNGVDFHKSIGYYVGGFMEGRADRISTVLELVFVDQLNNFDGTLLAQKSIMFTIGPSFYLSEGSPLSIGVGATAGHDLGTRWDGEKLDIPKDVRAGGYAGLNYDLQKIKLQMRFLRELRGSNMLHFGLNYTLFQG